MLIHFDNAQVAKANYSATLTHELSDSVSPCTVASTTFRAYGGILKSSVLWNSQRYRALNQLQPNGAFPEVQKCWTSFYQDRTVGDMIEHFDLKACLTGALRKSALLVDLNLGGGVRLA